MRWDKIASRSLCRALEPFIIKKGGMASAALVMQEVNATEFLLAGQPNAALSLQAKEEAKGSVHDFDHAL